MPFLYIFSIWLTLEIFPWDTLGWEIANDPGSPSKLHSWTEIWFWVSPFLAHHSKQFTAFALYVHNSNLPNTSGRLSLSSPDPMHSQQENAEGEKSKFLVPHPCCHGQAHQPIGSQHMGDTALTEQRSKSTGLYFFSTALSHESGREMQGEKKSQPIRKNKLAQEARAYIFLGQQQAWLGKKEKGRQPDLEVTAASSTKQCFNLSATQNTARLKNIGHAQIEATGNCSFSVAQWK